MLRLLHILIIPGLLAALPLRAEEILGTESGADRVVVRVEPDYWVFSLNTGDLSGGGLAAAVDVAVSEDFALGALFSYAWASDGAGASIYYAQSLRLVYALTGQLLKSHHRISMDGAPTVRYRGHSPGGLRLGLSMSQYFLNSTSSSVPYSGAGAFLFYEFPAWPRVSHGPGVAADSVTNVTDSPLALRAWWGLSIYL